MCPTVFGGAQSFDFPGDSTGLLLLHGWTATPSQFRELGEVIHARLGITVQCPLYPGHGTTPEDMATTGWHDWNRTAVAALHDLEARCQSVYVAGLSMGGVLSLHLAAHHNVSGVISINAPMVIWNKKVKLIPIVKFFRKWDLVGEPDPGVGKYPNLGYGRIPLNGIQELMRCIRHVRKELPRVKVPCRIIQNEDDRTVKPVSGQIVYDRVKSRDKELNWVKKGGHVVTTSAQRQQVFDLVEEFIVRQGGRENDFDNNPDD